MSEIIESSNLNLNEDIIYSNKEITANKKHKKFENKNQANYSAALNDYINKKKSLLSKGESDQNYKLFLLKKRVNNMDEDRDDLIKVKEYVKNKEEENFSNTNNQMMVEMEVENDCSNQVIFNQNDKNIQIANECNIDNLLTNYHLNFSKDINGDIYLKIKNDDFNQIKLVTELNSLGYDIKEYNEDLIYDDLLDRDEADLTNSDYDAKSIDYPDEDNDNMMDGDEDIITGANHEYVQKLNIMKKKRDEYINLDKKGQKNQAAYNRLYDPSYDQNSYEEIDDSVEEGEDEFY